MESPSPEITAQGFDIEQVQEGVVGEFGRIRVRFEVPGRIESLQIRERSFEVDLASTPERQHLPLFGLKRQVRQVDDVTLDFSTYINEKLRDAGDYVFDMLVKDRRDRSATATLKVQVYEAAPAPNERDTLDTGQFQFIRRGASSVIGAGEFGITWTTVEPNQVVVSITRIAEWPGKLFELDAAAFGLLNSRADLRREAEKSQATRFVLLPAANNGSAGRVFGVMHEQVPGILRITSSESVLTEVGTTVTLTGEYKR
jgi:hypothetical protein